MSAQNPPKTIKYVRRADRTPEKDFHTMYDDEKKHISVTRSAVNRVRDKVTHLEDEIDKRSVFDYKLLDRRGYAHAVS